VAAFVPPAAAALVALAAVVVVQRVFAGTEATIVTGLVFLGVFAITIRMVFPRELGGLIGCLPQQQRLSRWLRLPSPA
jgi:hypothetical protein